MHIKERRVAIVAEIIERLHASRTGGPAGGVRVCVDVSECEKVSGK